MQINGKHELLAQFARRGLLLVGLLATAVIFSNSSRAQSSITSSPAQDAKPAVAAVAAQAQTPAAIAKPASAQVKPQETSEEKHSTKSEGEGITVHGHWSITVKNPDGTVASHNEFENALADQGPSTITGLLGATFVPAGFQVILDSSASGGAGPCGNSTSNILGGTTVTTSCGLIDSRTTGSICGVQGCSNNLSFSPISSSVGNGLTGFSLSGSALANQAGTIGFVVTSLAYCGALPSPSSANPLEGGGANPVTPFQCGALGPPNAFGAILGVPSQTGITNLTSRTLSTPIPVASGQSVSVTVAITFSG